MSIRCDVLDAIEKATPFLDQNHRADSKKWKPSELMRIMYFMVDTGRRPHGAVEAVNDLLDEARNRYAAGFYADPFCEPVQVRPLAGKDVEP